MKLFRKPLATFLMLGSMALPEAIQAQRWEVGAGGGGSFFTSQEVKNAVASGDVGMTNAVSTSLWFGNNVSPLIGGELRYDYENTKFQVSSSATRAKFGADTHAVHYDFLFHFTPQTSRIRPYVSGGGGVKLYRGTGLETAFQPLSNLALLTKTNDIKGLVSVGAGVKLAVTPTIQVRLEFRDALTQFPSAVIAPAQNTKIGGWIHDFTVMIGLSLTF